jgi:diadenosine tetraphosphate (Ap4A) HIT family hydrolase
MCVFCDLFKEHKHFYENEYVIAIFDSFPVNKGHALIIPKRHFANYFEASKEELDSINQALFDVKKMLEVEFRPDGYNIGVNINEPAGQTVMHLHVHLIPRYIGDMENPRGGVRGVIPSKQKY